MNCNRKSLFRNNTLKMLRLGLCAIGVVVIAMWSFWWMAPFISTRPSAAISSAEFKRHLDERVPALLQRFGVPGVSVANVIDGIPADSYAYGYANFAQQRPMSVDSMFEVASISKSFTAWGIMRLVDAGQMELDAPVERYIAPWPLPDSSFPRDQVTVRRLLQHTAGVNPGNLGVRNPDEPALATRSVLQGEGTHPLVETAGPTRLEFPAMARFLYSNPGYTLLQLAIEQETGWPYADYMKHQILGPMGMTSSSFNWDLPLRDRTATPYLSDGSAGQITILNDQATGSLFSTAPDLARFIAISVGADPNEILTTESRSELYSPGIELPVLEVQGLASDAGAMGHYVERLADSRSAIMNGGFVPGWTSQFYFLPDSGDGIVVLTNSDRGRAVIAEIAADWAAWRGLPALKMTRTYNIVGIAGPIIIGSMILIALVIGFDTATGLVSRRRRFVFAVHGKKIRALAQLTLALVLNFVWFGFARTIVMFGFPWLELPMTTAMVVLGMALLFSALFPNAPRPSQGKELLLAA
jgi:CubicO group peptidase (beta-lactamase class C family)